MGIDHDQSQETDEEIPVDEQTARYAFSPNPPPVKVRICTASAPARKGHQTVNELPQPQPPDAFGFRKVKP